MRQHAIPQNILDIEFKLFTKFTVREFVYMAIGVGFGGIFLYFFSRGDLPAIIAIPIFLVSSGLGLFLGLVDLNDQKADIYLRNYIWAITHPTQRVWRNQMIDEKLGQIKPEFNVTQGSTQAGANGEENTEIIGASTDAPKTQFLEQNKMDEIEREERERLNNISQVAQATTGIPIQQEIQRPTVPINNAPVEQVAQNIQTSQPEQVVSQPISQTQQNTLQPETTPQIQTPPPQPQPQPQSIRIDRNNFSQYSVPLVNPGPYSGNLNFKLFTNQNQPLSQAVMVIKDEQGRIVSALQSDPNGEVYSNKQFPMSTYSVQLQAGGYTFPAVQIVFDEGIDKPIKIVAN